MPTEPFVSCIMPTKDRRPFIAAALDCWLSQTYEKRELVIVDDGQDKIRGLIPVDPRIRYYEEPTSSTRSLGRKRNYCCDLSRGSVICHWDDDDWSAPDRIADQVARMQEAGLPVVGYGTLFFWDIVRQAARRYTSSVPNYVCGTSLCYSKDYWKQHPFPDKQVASDNGFVYPAAWQKLIARSDDASHMVARIHGSHTSRKDSIREIVSREMLPAGFWENEELRRNASIQSAAATAIIAK